MTKTGMTPQQAAEIRAQKGLAETKLQKMRVKKGLSQAELAAVSGVTVKRIQNYEQQVRPVDGAKVDILCDLSIALECRIEEIIENEETIKKLHALYKPQ